MKKGLIKISTLNMSREEWLKIRRERIGGSDAAAVCGLSKWASAYSVWANKRGITPDEEDNEAMRQGRDLEAYCAERFSEQTGKKVRRENAIIVNPDYPFAHANVDRVIVGEDALLECKTTSSLNTKRFHDVEFPEDYYIQCLHYLAITGAKRIFCAVLVLGREFHVFKLDRDEAEIALLMKKEAEFWKLVESGTPPEVDGSEATAEALKAEYPEDFGGDCDLTDCDRDVQRYLEINAEIKGLKEAQEYHKQVIQKAMGDAADGMCRSGRVSWELRGTEEFDKTRFKREHPEIYKNYTNLKTSRTFRVTRAKEV